MGGAVSAASQSQNNSSGGNKNAKAILIVPSADQKNLILNQLKEK